MQVNKYVTKSHILYTEFVNWSVWYTKFRLDLSGINSKVLYLTRISKNFYVVYLTSTLGVSARTIVQYRSLLQYFIMLAKLQQIIPAKFFVNLIKIKYMQGYRYTEIYSSLDFSHSFQKYFSAIKENCYCNKQENNYLINQR